MIRNSFTGGSGRTEPILEVGNIMDQAISTLIGVLIFAAFALGLATSIGTAPFIIIVLIVLGMAITDAKEVVDENTDWLKRFQKGKSSAK